MYKLDEAKILETEKKAAALRAAAEKAVDEIYGNEIKLKKFVYLLEFYIPKSVKRNLMIALSGFKKLGRK